MTIAPSTTNAPSKPNRAAVDEHSKLMTDHLTCTPLARFLTAMPETGIATMQADAINKNEIKGLPAMSESAAITGDVPAT